MSPATACGLAPGKKGTSGDCERSVVGEKGRTPGTWETGAGGPVEGRGHGRAGRRSRRGDSGCVAVLLMPGLLHHLREWCWKVVHLGCLQTAAPPRPPSSMLRSHVVAANARIDCTTQDTIPPTNIEVGRAGGRRVPTPTKKIIGSSKNTVVQGGAIIRASTVALTACN